MRILAIETSGPHGGIALADSERLLDQRPLDEGLRHGRDLLVAVRDACSRTGWTPKDIELVAVSIGPGSFTGIRIAVIFAKFTAWHTGARLVAVPSLRALAENAPPDATRVVPILDAKRGGLFASVFERRRDGFEETLGPALIEPEDLARRLRPPAFILGRGIPKARHALGGFDLAPKDLWDVRPSAVARLGLAMDARGEHADLWRLEPVYIRPPEAEELWQRRHS
jgi:tRNA threonylcarbamoyladenosine biosynthesis protein TsaB